MIGTVYNARSDITQSFRYAPRSPAASTSSERPWETTRSGCADHPHRSGCRYGQSDHDSSAYVRRVAFLGLAGLPALGNLSSPPDGDGADLRPALRPVHVGIAGEDHLDPAQKEIPRGGAVDTGRASSAHEPAPARTSEVPGRNLTTPPVQESSVPRHPPPSGHN